MAEDAEAATLRTEMLQLAVRRRNGEQCDDSCKLDGEQQTAGTTSGATVIGAYSGRAGCQADCQNPAWAFADHPPVYVDITPR